MRDRTPDAEMQLLEALSRRDPGLDVWALKQIVDKYPERIVPELVRLMDSEPDRKAQRAVVGVLSHVLHLPAFGPMALPAFKRYIAILGADSHVSMEIENALCRLSDTAETGPWQKDLVQFALETYDRSPEARKVALTTAWAVLSAKSFQASRSWTVPFFQSVARRAQGWQEKLQILKGLAERSVLPFEDYLPLVVFIGELLDDEPYHASLLFAAHRAYPGFLKGFCVWVAAQDIDSLSPPLQQFRLAQADPQLCEDLARDLTGDAALYFHIYGKHSPETRAACATWLRWKRIDWPKGAEPRDEGPIDF